MPEGADFSQFAGKPVKDFTLEEGIVDPTSFAYRVSCDDEAVMQLQALPTEVEISEQQEEGISNKEKRRLEGWWW